MYRRLACIFNNQNNLVTTFSAKLSRISMESLAGNPRATLSSWLKYEPVVLAAYRQHPKPYSYRPANMSSATVSSRLRDAVRGMLAFCYSCEVPHDALLAWYSEVKIRHDGTNVIIGPLEKNPSQLEGEGSDLPLYSFKELSLEEIVAFTVLISGNRISGPIYIASPPDVSLLPIRGNVEIVKKEDGTLMLV